ncbi:hypothetical protein ZOSMA_4G01280 [Zostera marina]|uniref:Dof zinc finger protein n=1 Tax=Zostera marina TaxID=29655 RepID=A0A0K9NYM2_ZOSMR|nr:hypothetical protein ZOSMA_4G01280 [Zostera marina]
MTSGMFLRWCQKERSMVVGSSDSKLVSGDLSEKLTSRRPPKVSCPRCHSDNTKFCYYNNYSRSQPRYFCKACRRHWTNGGTLRNVPIGGGRKNKKRSKTTHRLASSSSSSAIKNDAGVNYISEIFKSRRISFSPSIMTSGSYLNNDTGGGGNILRPFLANFPDSSLPSTYSFLPFGSNREEECVTGEGYGMIKNGAGNCYYGVGDSSWQKTETTTACSFPNLTGFEFSSTIGGGSSGGSGGGYWASYWDELGGFSTFPPCNGFP